MEQPEQYQLIQMVNHTMVFIARCFLIPAMLQFVVITRYYASLRLTGNKNQRTLNPIQLRFLGLPLYRPVRFGPVKIRSTQRKLHRHSIALTA
jgi:hypothetical protein